MKKILLALLASTAVGGMASAQSFPDVPADSYAAEAVSRLADLGIVIGFPDGTFKGNDAFTRYQAALVVTRLLDVVDAQTLSDADLDTVRNALQELASDVAANQQAVSDLQAAIAGSEGADPEAIADLQSQLDALTVQLDTLEAAGAGSTDQLGQLSQQFDQLNSDVQAMGMASGDPAAATEMMGSLDQNTSDIANLREFVVLLRRDQVGITDRVATLEESDTAQSARLDDIETRVTALEESQVAFGGSIGLKYDVGRLSSTVAGGPADPFDVDRIFGVGLERPVTESVFSTGNEDQDDDDDDSDDPGEVAQDRQDIENQKGEFGPELTLTVDFSAERGLAPESGLNSFESSVALSLEEATALEADADVDEPGYDFTDPDNYFEAYVFKFESVTASLGPIGADPLNFYYGDAPGAEFSDYVFESLGPGFRADVGTPDFLAFLQPTLQVAYGVYDKGGDDSDDTLELPDDGADVLASAGELPATPIANPFTDAYYRGIRGTLTPFSGEGFAATGGFSVGQIAGNAAENADAAANNANITAYGVDGDLTLSIFNLSFEYAQNDIGDGVVFQANDDVLENAADEAIGFDGVVLADDADEIPVAAAAVENSSVIVAELGVDTEAAGIPLLRSLSANYRSVPEFWYGLKYDEDTYPWETDQVGYGADATAGLSIFNLTLFYDSYTIANDVTEGALDPENPDVTGNLVNAYGVEFGAELYRAVEVFGFYNYVTLNGAAVDFLTSADRNDEYSGGYGVGLKQDGEAENALFPGVDFEVRYNISASRLEAANIDTEVTVGALTLAPFVDFSVDASNLEESDDNVGLEAGLSVSSEPLDVILQPSLVGNINYRNTFHFDLEDAAADYTTDVLQYSVGLAFNQFLFENSVLGVRYGSFSGTNLSLEPNTTEGIDGEDFASDISDDDANNGATQTTNGYEVTWDYYGLAFGYGVYFNTNPVGSPSTPGTTAGQAFSISYTVNF